MLNLGLSRPSSAALWHRTHKRQSHGYTRTHIQPRRDYTIGRSELLEKVGRYVGYRWLMGREEKTWGAPAWL